MLFRRYGRFAGGIDLPDEKVATLNLPIDPYRPTETLRVPLGCCGTAATAIVEVAQKVARAEKIAKAAPGGVDVFSPVEGRVAGFCTVRVAVDDEFVSSPAVEIAPDAGQVESGRPVRRFDWRTAGASALRERIAGGALTTHRRPVEPLDRWVHRARARGCRTLIANAMENQPYVSADHRLLVEYGEEVMGGLAILGKAIDAHQVIIAADSRRTADYQQIADPGRTYGIARIALPHKYPTGADPMLVKVLLRRETPPGGSTMKVGAAVTDPATCLAVFRSVACEIPPTARAVTIAGPRAPEPRNYWVPFGTRCLALVEDAAQPVIHNGPMVGLRCPPDAVVGPATDVILALEAAVPNPPTPCIRCSWCTDHCPARLNVAALNDAFELGRIAQARRLIAPACVECGVCTYVCPARLPLSQRVKQLKRAIQHNAQSMPLFASP